MNFHVWLRCNTHGPNPWRPSGGGGQEPFRHFRPAQQRLSVRLSAQPSLAAGGRRREDTHARRTPPRRLPVGCNSPDGPTDISCTFPGIFLYQMALLRKQEGNGPIDLRQKDRGNSIFCPDSDPFSNNHNISLQIIKFSAYSSN